MSLPKVDNIEQIQDSFSLSKHHHDPLYYKSPLPIAIIAKDGTFIHANRACCQFLGRTLSDLLTKKFQDITHPEDLDADVNELQLTIKGKISSYTMQKRYLTPFGEVIYANLFVQTFKSEETGELLYFISHIIPQTSVFSQKIEKNIQGEIRIRPARIGDWMKENYKWMAWFCAFLAGAGTGLWKLLTYLIEMQQKLQNLGG